jgi:hypothetical protein
VRLQKPNFKLLPISVITNGYDVESVDVQAIDVKFSLAHIGSFCPIEIACALGKFSRDFLLKFKFQNDLEIKLIER